MAHVQFFGNFRSAPVWAGDFGGREHILAAPAKIDASAFSDAGAVVVTVGAAGALANATTLPVDAIAPAGNPSTTLISGGTTLIPAGTTLYFGGEKIAVTTADAAIGATSLSVAALPNALVDNDTARYSRYGAIFVPSGTPIGRTYAERAANTAFGPAAVTDDEIYLSMFDVVDARVQNDVELYRHGSIVKETFLPDYSTLAVTANEVQTLTFGVAASGGTLRLIVPKTDGTTAITGPITWDATDATWLANINTALDAATGVTGGIVATGAAPDTALTFTFSGTGYAGKTWPLIQVHTFPTSTTTANVVRATTGSTTGSAMLTKIRELYQCITGAA